jgi:hypothetical protein
MSDASRGEQPYRDCARECRRLAENTLSSQLKNRYLLMAKGDVVLAQVEEQAQHDALWPSSTGFLRPFP